MSTADRPTDTTGAPTGGHEPTQHYAIRVDGQLGPRWSAWFDGLTISNADDGTTVISGPVVDQAALYGLIQKLRDVGIPLISLTQQPPDGSTTPNEKELT